MGAAYSFHLALHEYFSAPGSNLGCRQDGDACALARARGKANATEYVGSTACGQTECTGHGVEAWACYHKGSQPSPATGRGWVDLGKLVTHLKSHTRHEKKRVCIGDLVKTKGMVQIHGHYSVSPLHPSSVNWYPLPTQNTQACDEEFSEQI